MSDATPLNGMLGASASKTNEPVTVCPSLNVPFNVQVSGIACAANEYPKIDSAPTIRTALDVAVKPRMIAARVRWHMAS
jgi:hypothetical protein